MDGGLPSWLTGVSGGDVTGIPLVPRPIRFLSAPAMDNVPTTLGGNGPGPSLARPVFLGFIKMIKGELPNSPVPG